MKNSLYYVVKEDEIIGCRESLDEAIKLQARKQGETVVRMHREADDFSDLMNMGQQWIDDRGWI